MKKRWEQAFDNYTKDFDMSHKQIHFKYYHSYEVEKLMIELSTRLKLNDKQKELAEVIGLLHDVGRFPQIQRFGDCSDTKTGVDHADLSCDFLFKEGHIKEYYEDKDSYKIIENSIRNHNKYRVSDNVDDDSMLFVKMIRDMDKVDIYRVIIEEYESSYNKNEITKEVLDEFNAHKTIESRLKKTNTDGVYAYLAFVYDINFKESFQILKEKNYINILLDKVVVTEDSIEEFLMLREKINKYIDEKIK